MHSSVCPFLFERKGGRQREARGHIKTLAAQNLVPCGTPANSPLRLPTFILLAFQACCWACWWVDVPLCSWHKEGLNAPCLAAAWRPFSSLSTKGPTVSTCWGCILPAPPGRSVPEKLPGTRACLCVQIQRAFHHLLGTLETHHGFLPSDDREALLLLFAFSSVLSNTSASEHLSPGHQVHLVVLHKIVRKR